jgi:hypothetical protein
MCIHIMHRYITNYIYIYVFHIHNYTYLYVIHDNILQYPTPNQHLNPDQAFGCRHFADREACRGGTVLFCPMGLGCVATEAA